MTSFGNTNEGVCGLPNGKASAESELRISEIEWTIPFR